MMKKNIFNKGIHIIGCLSILILLPIKIFCVDIPEGSNHPPSFTVGPDQVINEDAIFIGLSNFIQNIKPGPTDDEKDQDLTFFVSNDNPDLFSLQPYVTPTGVLYFQPAPDQNGSSIVSIYLKDNGGTENGGKDQSQTQTFKITVRPVNDPPSFFKGANQSVIKNAELQDIPGWATGLYKGPSDEQNQHLTFIIKVDRKDIFKTLPQVSSDGTLTYEPARDAYGQANVSVKLQDDGGLDYGGKNTSPEQSFTISIIWANHAPSFSKGPDIRILEDAPTQDFDNWATNIKSGPDEESFQNVYFVPTADQPDLFSLLPSIASNGKLTFRPKPDENGKTLVTVFLKDDGGTQFGGQDQSDSQTFFLEIKAVNDPPEFTPGPDQIIPQNSGPQLVPSWAQNISPGPSDEADQKVKFLVSTDKPELFISPPVILSNGSLYYTPTSNAYGNAVMTVSLQDNGGTYDNGDDTSDAYNFNISVIAVNHAPLFTPGDKITIPEDSGQVTFENWATDINAGTPEESYQNLTFYAFGIPSEMFSIQPEITLDGTLSFETSPDINGLATIRMFLKDDGGTENGGKDQSEDYYIDINITPVNDPPRPIPNTLILEEDTPAVYTLTAIDIENDPITYDIFVPPQKGVLVIENPITGRCLYSPYTDSVGTDFFEFQAFDHATQSEPAKVTIEILPVNDAPVLSKIQNQTTMEDVPTSPIEFYVSDSDSRFDDLTLVITSDNQTLVPDNNIVVQGSAGKRALIITPEPNEYGMSTITLRISDNSNLFSQVQFILHVQKRNDPPTLSEIDNQIIFEDQTSPPIIFSINDSETPVASLDIEIEVSDPLKIPENNIQLSGVDVIRTLTLKPVENVSGDINVTVNVYDEERAVATQSFVLQIIDVNDPPLIEGLSNQTILEDNPSKQIVFSISDPDTPLNEISVRGISSDESIISNDQIDIAGQEMDRTIQFMPSHNQTGTLRIDLIANDGISDSDISSFQVTIIPVNDLPMANAGENYSIGEGRTVYLDASKSMDPEDNIIFYQWEQVSGTQVNIDNPTEPKTFFKAPDVGPNGTILIFKLLIIDHDGEKSEDTIEITIEDMAGQYMIEALAGNNGSIEPSGQLFVYTYSSKTFFIHPQDNYDIQDVLINGKSIGPVSEYTFYDIQADQTIQAFFIARPKISVLAEGNGKISPQGTIFVNRGDPLTLSFTPDDGHILDYILVDNRVVAPKLEFNFSDIQFDHTITAYFISQHIFVETEAGNRGIVAPSGKIQVTPGSDLTINIFPDPGYEVADVQVNEISIGPVTSHTFVGIRANTHLYARFRPIVAKTIHASSGNNGHIFPEGDTNVFDGLAQSFVMIPDDTYQVADILIDNVSIGPMDRYTFPAVEKNYNIHVLFEHQPKITAQADPHGSIQPNGEIYVTQGWYQKFTIESDENYEVKDVIVNGDSIGSVSGHIFLEIVEDLSISAKFQPMPKITATTNYHGTIIPSGTIIIPRNSFQQFKMTPDPGYRFDKLLVNGIEHPIPEGQVLYTVANIEKDYSLNAQFVLDQYTINASSGAFGSISPTGNVTISGKESQTFIFSPDTGYEVARVLLDGESIGRVLSYELESIVSDHVIRAEFIKIPQIIAEAGSNGHIEPQGIINVHNGDYQMFLIKPDKGYKVASLMVDDQPVSTRLAETQGDNLWKSYVFPSVDKDHSIRATFNRCYIELRTNGNGLIFPNKDLEYDVFDNVSYSFQPNDGFVVENVIVDREPLGPRSFYNFWELTEDHIIEVNFRAIEIQTLTITASPGGSITPSGIIKVMGGEYAEFMITPDDMYELSEILLNGTPIIHGTNESKMLPVGKEGYYVSLNVTSDQEIRANFEEIPKYTIYAISGSNGKVEPSDAIEVLHGQYQLFTFKPDPGFAVYDVQLDNESQGQINSFSLSVMKNHILTVSFFPINTCVIEGTVVDKEAITHGLENFMVEVWQGDDLLKTSTTNINGEYRFENLPAANNLVLAAWPPLGKSDYYGSFYNDKRERMYADQLSTLAGDLQDIQFRMQRAFEEGIRGQVRIDGKGVPFIVVDVFEDSATFVKNVTTDENGYYTLTGLDPSEDYKVSVWYLPYATEYFYSIPDFIEPGAIVPTESALSWDRAKIFRSQYPPLSNIDIIIDPGASIRGTVFKPDGSPAQGIRVNAVSEKDQSGNGALTDNAGHYTIIGLTEVSSDQAATDGYIVEIQAVDYPYIAYPQAVNQNQAQKVGTGRTDIDFQLKKGHSISGIVRHQDGSPAENIQVFAWSQKNPEIKNSSAISDASGRYTIANLPVASDYVISVISDLYPIHYYSGSHHIEYAELINLLNASAKEIHFTLKKGPIINGYVYANQEMGGNKPGSDIWVNVWSESTQTGGDVITDNNGYYEMTGLVLDAHDYQISVIYPGFQPAFYRETPDDNLMNDTVYLWKDAGSVSPATDETQYRNIVLNQGVTFAGMVVFDNQPVSGTTVEIFSDETSGWGRTVSTDRTDTNIIITGLIPGIYSLKTQSADFADTQIARINLEQSILDYHIQLTKPDRSISGTIIGLRKNEEVRINAWSRDTQCNGYVEVKGSGFATHFLIDGLQSASDYLLEAYSKHYPRQVYDGRSDILAADLVDVSLHDVSSVVFRFENKGTFKINGHVTFPQDCQVGESIWVEAWSASTDTLIEQQLTFLDNHVMPYTLVGNAPANDYEIRIRATQFVDMTFSNHLNTEEHASITDIQFILSRGTQISGRITNGQQVGIRQVTAIAWSDQLGTGSQVNSLPDGHFTISGLAKASDYRLELIHNRLGRYYYHPNHAVRDISQAALLDNHLGDISEISVKIFEGVCIQGYVSEIQGKNLSGIWVHAWSASTQSGNGVFTDHNGFYNIQGLEASNDYKVQVLPEHHYLPDEKQNISAPCDSLDFRLTKTEGYRVIGTVYNCDKNPLHLARIEFQSANNEHANGWSFTSPDGSYEIKQLPPHTDYIVSILPPDNSESAFMRMKSVSVNADRRLDIHLEPELKFSGRLTDDATSTPVDNASVVVFSESNGFWEEVHPLSDGYYELHHVPAGNDYMIIVNAQDYLESKRTGLTPGVDINFTLETGGNISGVVKVASTGKGMADVPVEVYSVSNAGLSNFGGIVRTDINGFYQVNQLKINDHLGQPIRDYVVFIYPEYFPPQSRGNKTTGETVNFVVAGGESNETLGTVPLFIDPHRFLVDVFENNGTFVTCVKADESGAFYVSGLHVNKKYQYRFFVEFIETGQSIVQWAGANSVGVDSREDAFAYSVPSTIYFEFHDNNRKRSENVSPLMGGPGPVQNLRSSSHAFQTINRRKRTITASGPDTVSNDPTVSVGWEPPATDAESIAGYYGVFTDEANTKLTKYNTDQQSPIRTRKITSRDLEGDDVNYYFHVAAVDIQGRVGETSSIAFRIDTVPPTNVSVIVPDISEQRNIQLKLGAGGASEMYISSESYQDGGNWEKLAQQREWQLTPGNGEKPIYVRFRDRAGNMSQSMAKTFYTQELPQFTIQLTAGDFGHISPSGTIIKSKGDDQLIEIIPDKNYQIKRMRIDGKALPSGLTSYTFENIHADHHLEVFFEKALFKILSSAGTHGQIFPDGEIIVEKGSSHVCMITPDHGYSVDQVLFDMTPIAWTGNPFVISDIEQGHQLFVTFSRSYTITTKSDTHGQVVPDGESIILEGHQQQFQFIPDKGYDIDQVLLDGSPVDIHQQALTLYNVQKNYDIQVSFKKVYFNIDVIYGHHGRIYPEGSLNVAKNDQKGFQIIPDPGFEIENLIIDGIIVEQAHAYTFTNILENHSIAASFKSKQFIVHTESGPHGIVSPQGDTAVNWGENMIFIAEPATNYAIDQVLLDNQPVKLTAGYYYTLTDIHANHDFSVTFKRVYQIASIVAGEGQTEPSGIVNVEQNQSQQFELIPDSGHELKKLQIDDKYILTDGLSYTFENVMKEHQLIATFAPIPIKITSTSGANGKISPSGIFTVDMFGDAKFFLTADPGYEMATLTIDGNKMPYTKNIYVMPSVEKSHEILAEYQLFNYPPTVSDATFSLLEDTFVCGKLNGKDGDGDRIIFEIVTMPGYGNANITNESEGLFCYTPNINVDQTDQFIFQVKDHNKTSNSGVVTLKIQSQNDAPQAMSEQWTVTEDTIFESYLLAMDVDADPLTYSIVKHPELGQAILIDRQTGEIQYHPKNNVTGIDSIHFHVSDGQLISNTSEIMIDIQDVNDMPTAYSSTVETGRGQALQLTLLASDIENDPLDYQIISRPSSGTLTPMTQGVYEYQPASGFIGTDHIIFLVNDGEYSSNQATVSIVIGTISAVTNEDQAVTLNIQYDATIIENFSHGKIQWIDKQPVYTPSKDYSGYDSLRYQNPEDPVIREIVVRIVPVNDPPILKNVDRIIVNEDESQSIPLDIEDPDGDPITRTYSLPGHGTIVESSTHLTYFPDENYHGTDQFIVRVTDGIFEATQVIHISVISKNDLPMIASLKTVEVMEDSAVDITIIASDVDQDQLVLQIVEYPEHGQIQGKTLDMMHLQYTPLPNFEGWDHCTFKVFDGLAHSATKQISIHVLSVNDIPSAQSLQLYGVENTTIKAQLKGMDLEEQQLSYHVFSQAEHGMVSITPTTGECMYIPIKNFVGYDEFSFTVNDGYTHSAPATVIIQLIMGNRPPMAENNFWEIKEDEPGNFTLAASDINNDDLTYHISSPPTLGQVQILDSQTGQCRYIPSVNTNGTDLFTFIASDGILDSNKATITVHIEPVNDRPVAQGDKLRMDEDSQVQGTLNGSDIDGDPLYVEIVSYPSQGKLELINPQTGQYSYRPFQNYFGTDSFQFVVNDSETKSLTASVDVIIDPQNDPPIATPLSFETLEDTTLSGILGGTDIDNDPVIFMIVESPNALSNGTIEIKDATQGMFNYYPPENEFGTFIFNYFVTDGKLTSSPVGLTINVMPANDPPVVFNQDLSTDKNEPLFITLSGSDIDKDFLLYEIIQPPTNGELVTDGDFWKYIPNADFQGTDFFNFQADDQSGSETSVSNIGTINIRVGVPVADFYTFEDNKVSIDLLSGTNFISEVIQYEIIDLPDHGLLKGEGQFQTYEADVNYSDMDRFQVRYIFSEQASIEREIQIYMIPVNDPPKLTGFLPTPAFTYEDQALTLTVLVDDPDTPLLSLTYDLKNPPENGQATIHGNIITYKPSKDYSGDDQLTVWVTDHFESSSSSLKIDIQIAPDNDVPISFDQTVETNEEELIIIHPRAFDQDADTLVYIIKQYPAHGSLQGASPTFTYVPQANFYGTDRFTFVASDGISMSDEGEILIHVMNVNDPPRANSSSFTLSDGTQISGRLLAMDEDYDILTYSLVEHPKKGLFTFTNPVLGTFVYYPQVNETGMDTFRFKVNDGSQDSNIASVNIALDSNTTDHQFAYVNVNINEPYTPYVASCTYMFIHADTGQMIVNGTTLKDNFDATLPKGNYRLIVLAPNYRPYEYQKEENQKYFILDNDTQLPITLTPQADFNPHPAGADISYMTTPDGIKIWAVKKNLNKDDQFYMHIQSPSGEIPVNHAETSGDGSSNSPYFFYWTLSSPWTNSENNTYEIEFIFYGGPYGHTEQVESVTLRWQKNDHRKRTPTEKDIIAHEFGQSPIYISQGASAFYPLAGTDCHVTLMDNEDVERHMTIHIPPIPLEYLYIDDSYGNHGGQLNYDKKSDRFYPDPLNSLETIAPDQQLHVEVNYYTFGLNKAGNGVSVSFFMAEGEFKGMPVRYNPIFMNTKNRKSNAPAIVIPVYLNMNSSFLSDVTHLQDILPKTRIHEAGDGVDGFRTENLTTTVENDGLVYIEMNHLTMVGLDVAIEGNTTPSNDSDDSSSACFVEGLKSNHIRWHEIIGFLLICFLFGLILRISNGVRLS